MSSSLGVYVESLLQLFIVRLILYSIVIFVVFWTLPFKLSLEITSCGVSKWLTWQDACFVLSNWMVHYRQVNTNLEFDQIWNYTIVLPTASLGDSSPSLIVTNGTHNSFLIVHSKQENFSKGFFCRRVDLIGHFHFHL